MNWTEIISEIIAADSASMNQVKAQQTTVNSQNTALGALGTDLTNLENSIYTLEDPGTFSAVTAGSTAGNSTWQVNADSGTAIGNTDINVGNLATASKLTGAGHVSVGLSPTDDVAGTTLANLGVADPITAGTFSVNGAQVTVTTSESLQDVFSAISTATGGNVTAAYDSGSDTVTLTAATGTVSLGADNDTSNFLSATSLYDGNAVTDKSTGAVTVSSASALGSVGLTSTIADSGLKKAVTDVDGSGNGTFTINGVAVDFNVNTDTLQTVMDKINSSNAGVTATFNNSNSQFTLTNNSMGDTGISVSEASGGLLDAMGLNTTSSFTAGLNASFTINGSGPFTSASNNLDASVDGINGLTINATSKTTQTVTVGTDTSGISTAINNLISAYNTVQTEITSQTQITTGTTGSVSTSTLSGNMDITGMQADLQNLMFNSISGLTGSITSLDKIGIGFTGTSPLLSVLDQNALNSAITSNPEAVANLFTSYPNGLVAQIDAYVTKATGPEGVIATQTNALNTDSTNFTTQINNLETQLTQEQASLTTEFTAMETAESQYQSEESTLNSILNTGSSSSSSSTSSPSTTQSSAFANASTSSATSSTS